MNNVVDVNSIGKQLNPSADCSSDVFQPFTELSPWRTWKLKKSRKVSKDSERFFLALTEERRLKNYFSYLRSLKHLTVVHVAADCDLCFIVAA